METFGTLLLGIGFLILLAVTSLRFGVDSRDGFRGRRDELTPRGIVWDVPSSAPKPLPVKESRERRIVSAPADCGLEPCAA